MLKNRQKSSIISCLIATLCVAICYIVFSFLFNAESLKFASASIEVDKNTAMPGEIFDISTTVGTAAGENVEKATFQIEINNPNIELLNFVDGKYSVTMPSGEVITYFCEYTDEGVIVSSSELDSGVTIQLKLDAVFKEETSLKGESVKITLKDGDIELASTEVTCDFDIDWTPEKTGPDLITTIDKDKITMVGSNTYTIKQIPSDETGIFDKDIKTIKMADTISFPNGMYIKSGSDIITALGLQEIQDKNLTYTTTTDENGNITSVSFSWEDENDYSTKEYNFTLDNDSFEFSDDFSPNNVTNVLDTTVVSKLGTEYPLDEKTVTTPIELITKDEHIADFKKEVVWSDTYNFGWDGSWGSAVQNNIIKYQISFKNNTDETKDFTLSDILPDSLSIMDESKFDDFPFWATDKNGNKIEAPAICDDYEYTIDGKKITWNITNVGPGETVSVYVFCIVSTNENGTIINTAKIDEKEVEHILPQKKNEGSVSIEKTGSYSGTQQDKEFEYIIKVSNSQSINAENRSIVDNIPDELELLSVDVKSCGPNSDSGTIKIGNNNISISDIIIGAEENIEYIIKVKIKEGHTSFTNTAFLYNDGKQESQSSFVNSDLDDISITKIASNNTVYPGDTLEYTITVHNKSNYDIDYSENPLKIEDNVPSEFKIKDAYYIFNQEETKDGLKISGNSLTLTFSDILKSNTNITIKIICEVLEINEDSKTTVNTVTANNLKDDVTVIIDNESSDLSVEKLAYHQDGTLADDVNKDEKIKFQIKITNNSKTLDVKRLFLQDYLNGIFIHTGHSIGKLNINVVETYNAEGIEPNTTLTRNGMWNEYTTQFNMLISSKESDKDNYELIYYNPEFALKPGGYIVLEYEFTTGTEFLEGSNKIVVNNKCEDEIFLKSKKPSIIDIQKTADSKNYSINDLENKEIYYSIRIDNKSEGNELFQHFKVEDILPDGLEFVPAWYGSPLPYFQIYYVEKDKSPLALWSFQKGGQAYVTTEGNKFIVEFGSVDDNGNSTLLNFKGGDYFEIRLKCRLTKEKIAELEQITDNIYPIEIFENKAIISSNTDFKDLDGNIVNELTDTEQINIVPNVPHPGINKEYTGAFSGEHTTLKQDALPGDSLVWTITISNQSTDGEGSKLENFIVKDIIPDDYIYHTDYDGEMYIITNDGKKQSIDFIEPTIENNIAEWNFSDISLNDDEKLIIKFAIKNKGNNKYQTVKNTAQLITQEIINPETISSGEQIDDYTLEDSASKDILINKTSSYKEIYYIPTGTHRNEPDEDYAYGYNSSPDNYIKGVAGEKIYYKLYLKNESTNNLRNICFVDRMPFIGDKGIISQHDRHSAYEIFYDDFVNAIVYDEKGNMLEDISSKVKISFSNNKVDSLNEDNYEDWHGGQGSFLWHDSYTQEDVNIRFTIEDYELEEMDYIELTFTGYIPETALSGIENIAWNNFAYSYDSDICDTTMIAEPPKVGVWVDKQFPSGEIIINKTLSSDNNSEQTFYFALFTKENEEYIRYSHIESLTITDKGSIKFSEIPYGQYFVFETDINGNILNSSAELTIIGQGTEANISSDLEIVNVEMENIITNKRATLIVKKYANEDVNKLLSGAVFELKNEENTYTMTTDDNGIAKFENIPFGTYILVETKAPEGYQLSQEEFEIVLTPENLNEDYIYQIDIDNFMIIYMPATGGKGYILYSLMGITTIFSCLIIYILNRKNCCKN